MSLENYAEKIKELEFTLGKERGRLSQALELLTETITLLHQHGRQCRNPRQPEQPKLEVELAIRELETSKELIQSVMDSLKK